MNAKTPDWLREVITASETIGRIELELERLRAVVAANDAKMAQAREAYVEMRSEFIRALVKAETKADFDALLAEYHRLVNASPYALGDGNYQVHRDISRLITQHEEAVALRETAWTSQRALAAPTNPPPPAPLDRDQAIALALQAEQQLLAKPHPPRLADRADTSSIQADILAVVYAAYRPVSVAGAHQALAAKYSLTQVRDGLSVLYRAGKVTRVERGIYSQCALSAK